MQRYVLNLLLLLLACTAPVVGVGADTLSTKHYSNPVVPANLPDPSILQCPDGWFYLYATEHHLQLPIMKSRNLVDWIQVGAAFTREGQPNFEPRGNLWAPDINLINGRYVLFYSMSVWGGEHTCGIGVEVSNEPEGPFTDRGKLFRSNEIGVVNSIDPLYIEDGGRKYLFWGSFSGIYGLELSADGCSVKPGAEKRQVAGRAFEGTYILKRNGYYYLFASTGTCCEGVNSTYRTVVGRSTSLFGPYADRSGKAMLDNGHEVLIDRNARFVGTGHNSEIVQDKAGNDWIFYHGVDLKHPSGRVLLLDQVKWDQAGWPYVEGGSPSLSATRPVF